jgi:hypothetical protein
VAGVSLLVLLGTAELFASAALGLASVVVYHWRTRGEWRHNPVGVHVMWFMIALEATLLPSVARVIIGASLDTLWFAWLRVIVFAGVPVVMAWRLAIIIRATRRTGGL